MNSFSLCILKAMGECLQLWSVHSFFYENEVYKNIEAQKSLKFSNNLRILII